MGETFLWHDYETNGNDPRSARPVQFAAVRTSVELDEVAAPVELYGRLPEDVLPDLDSTLVHGLGPQILEARGLPEPVLMRRVFAELSLPGTCGVGFNSFDFDDEVTRFSLWRSLLPVYAREWGEGRTRWDLIDALRAAHAMRPVGIEWPRGAEGHASFKLGDLAAANGIQHVAAHDALADVRATIGLARLLREKQPRLWSYLLELRDKKRVLDRLGLGSPRPLLHVSGRLPAAQACATIVLPICERPDATNQVILVDLRDDPEPMLDLPIEEVRRLLFLRREDRRPGEPRIPLKTIYLAKAPVVAPLDVLDDAMERRLDIDRAGCQARAAALLAEFARVRERVCAVYAREPVESEDVELALYAGGFVSPRDAETCRRLQATPAPAWRLLENRLGDPRLRELAYRCRARWWPETLDADERRRWRDWVRQRTGGDRSDGAATLLLGRIAARSAEGAVDSRTKALLAEVDTAVRRGMAAFAAT